jgi:hypothetical protein
MSIKAEYTPFGGGLDLNSSALNVKAGRLLSCSNFERVYGRQGYKRIDGYERYDGHPRPSDASYLILEFSGGVTQPAIGDKVVSTIDIAGGYIPYVPGYGIVHEVVTTSGTWGSNAAGYMVVVQHGGTP